MWLGVGNDYFTCETPVRNFLTPRTENHLITPMRTAWRMVGLASLLLLTFFARPSEGQGRRELYVALPSLPKVLDPATEADGPLLQVSRQVFETLVQYREDGSEI